MTLEEQIFGWIQNGIKTTKEGWAVNIERSVSTEDTPLKCCQQCCQTALFSVCVYVCVFECVRAQQDLSTDHLTEQELKASGSFGTEVNLGCSHGTSFPLSLILCLYFCLAHLFFLSSFIQSFSPSHQVPFCLHQSGLLLSRVWVKCWLVPCWQMAGDWT